MGSFEALYIIENFEIDTGSTLQSKQIHLEGKVYELIKHNLVPHNNIATITNNAIVIEGVSRSRNALLNGDTTNYDWDNGYFV